MNFYVKVNAVCQDSTEEMHTAAKEGFEHSDSFPYSAHVRLKCDDSSVGKKIRNRENIETIKKQVDSMMQWKAVQLKNHMGKVMHIDRISNKDEGLWDNSFCKVWIKVTNWRSK